MTSYIRRTLLPILESLAAEEDIENQNLTTNKHVSKVENSSSLRSISDSLAKMNLYGVARNRHPCPRYKKQINSPLSISNILNVDFDHQEESIPEAHVPETTMYDTTSVLMNSSSDENRHPHSKVSLLPANVCKESKTKESTQQDKVGEVLDTCVLQPSATLYSEVRKYGGILGNFMDGLHAAKNGDDGMPSILGTEAMKRNIDLQSPNARSWKKRVTVQSMLAMSPSFIPLKRRDRKKTPIKPDECRAFENDGGDIQKAKSAGAGTNVFGSSDDVTKATLQTASGSSDEVFPTDQANNVMTSRALFTDCGPKVSSPEVFSPPIFHETLGTDLEDYLADEGVENGSKQENESIDSTRRRELGILTEEDLPLLNDRCNENSFLAYEEAENLSWVVDEEGPTTALLGIKNEHSKSEREPQNVAHNTNNLKSDPVMPVKYVRLDDNGAAVSPLGNEGVATAGKHDRMDEYDFPDEFQNSDMGDIQNARSSINLNLNDNEDEDDMAVTLLKHESVQHKMDSGKNKAFPVGSTAKVALVQIKYKSLDDAILVDNNKESAHRDAAQEHQSSTTKTASKDNLSRCLLSNEDMHAKMVSGFSQHSDADSFEGVGKSFGNFSVTKWSSDFAKQTNAMMRCANISQSAESFKPTETSSQYATLAEDDEMEPYQVNAEDAADAMSAIAKMSPMSTISTPQTDLLRARKAKASASTQKDSVLDDLGRDCQQRADNCGNSTASSDNLANAPVNLDTERRSTFPETNATSPAVADDFHTKLMSVKFMRLADTKISQLIVDLEDLNALDREPNRQRFSPIPSLFDAVPPSSGLYNQHTGQIITPKCKPTLSKVMSLEFVRTWLPPFALKDQTSVSQRLSDLIDSADSGDLAFDAGRTSVAKASLLANQAMPRGVKRSSPSLPLHTSPPMIPIGYRRRSNQRLKNSSRPVLTSTPETNDDQSKGRTRRSRGPKRKYRRIARNTAKIPKPSRNISRRSSRRPKPPDRFGFKQLSEADHRRNNLPSQGDVSTPHGQLFDGASATRLSPQSAAKDVVCRRTKYPTLTSNESNDQIDSSNIVKRRSARPRMQTERFGDFRNHDEILRTASTPSSTESTMSEPAQRSVAVTKKGVLPVNLETEAVDPTRQNSSESNTSCKANEANTENQNINEPDCWSSEEIETLELTMNCTNAHSSSFWEDIALCLESKTATACREKWFSLIKTPAARGKRDKNTAGDWDSSSLPAGDDAFHSTPMRGLLGPVVDLATPLLTAVHLEAGRSTIESANNEEGGVLESSAYGDVATLSFRAFRQRKGYKAYLQNLKRDLNRAKKDENKIKQRQQQLQQQQNKGNKIIWESIDDGEVDMNCRLTPGGTLRFSDLTELEEEEIYFVDDDEDDSV